MKNPFGKVDNLSHFIHPKYEQKFQYMNEKQSLMLAKEILNKMLKTNYKNIIAIESGTAPLVELIKKQKEYQNSKINLLQIKIPRELDFNLYEWLRMYLTENELVELIEWKGKLEKREEALKQLCLTFNLKKFVGEENFTIYDSIQDLKTYGNERYHFQEVLIGTELSKIFNEPFLVFDEYINAGTIIRNFNAIVRLFAETPRFKLSAFCMFLENPKKYEKIAFTLYDLFSELQCYQNGAYPFENRIDLIGYYFYISKDHFEKIFLNQLKEETKIYAKLDINIFYKKLYEVIEKQKLVSKLKESLKESQVKSYIKDDDIARYYLKYVDEKKYGKNKFSDFLDQVFELYAPAWSPMPTIFHLDYWAGFENIKDEFDKDAFYDIENQYESYRNQIMQNVLRVLKENKEKWELKLDEN